MKRGDMIQLLAREAAVYHAHGLYTEAMACCKKALAMLAPAADSPVKRKIKAHLSGRISAIKADAEKLDALEKSPQLSSSQAQVVESGMGDSEGGKSDQAAFQIAANLMGFGQFNRALSEFDALLKNPKLKVPAAKNILRCQIAVGSADMAIRQYYQWLEAGDFAADELDKVRTFLEGVLQRKGIEEELSGPDREFSAEDAGPEEASFDVVAAMLPDFTGNRAAEPPVFDVSSQSGGLVSLIVPESEKPVVAHLKPGARIRGASFFTPEALFSEDCIVSSRFRIDEGRRKGDFSVTLRLLGK